MFISTGRLDQIKKFAIDTAYALQDQGNPQEAELYLDICRLLNELSGYRDRINNISTY